MKTVSMLRPRSLLARIRFSLAARGMPLTRNERRLLSLRDRFAGRRIFIIGNGPSLKNTDMSLLRDEVTIGCNGLFLMFDKMGFLPTFYTVEDKLVAEDRADVINQIRGATKVFPADLTYCLKSDDDTVFVNFLRQYNGFPRFTTDFVDHAYFGGTVTYLNLELAYFLGSREVYLVGTDHSYRGPTRKDERQGFVITSHTRDEDHFHPDYFGPGFRYHDPNVDRMEKAYRKARAFFENNGARICNATVGGRLEVFERTEYTSLFR